MKDFRILFEMLLPWLHGREVKGTFETDGVIVCVCVLMSLKARCVSGNLQISVCVGASLSVCMHLYEFLLNSSNSWVTVTLLPEGL